MGEEPESLEAEAEAVTEEVHENSWSANLERDRHTERHRVLREAVQAVDHTAPGHHVNLVTHGEHGHPEGYLYEHLGAECPSVEWEFVSRCGCGGYVTRVHVEA
jgi:putative CGCGG family rSAM target protein